MHPYEETIKQFVILTDYVYPTLSRAEQSIMTVLFSRTILEGKSFTKISFSQIQELTGAKTSTIRAAVKRLKEKNHIDIILKPTVRTPGTYRLNIPTDVRPTSSLQRNPNLLFRTPDVPGGDTGDTGERYIFKEEAELMIESIMSTLDPEEKANIKRLAKMTAKTPEEVEYQIKKIVVDVYFVNSKKAAYVEIVKVDDKGNE